MTEPLPVAVLISGHGTTLQHFVDLRQAGQLDIDIRLVVTSRATAPGLQRARAAGIPTVVVPHGSEGFSRQITAAVRAAGSRLVCMAGFLSMWIIPPEFEHRVMNIHPALLPGFGGKGYYGMRVHRAVLEAGCKVSGSTVHFADNQYDQGPIILQKCVTVRESDTPEQLARRVTKSERIIYPQAIRLFAEHRLRVVGRRVHILEPPPDSGVSARQNHS